MIGQLLAKQTWLDAQAWRQANAGKQTITVRNVLLVTSTLTRFLERQYGLRLDVLLHDQFVDYPTEKEADLLHILPQRRCLRRKVSLLCRNEVMFDAESVLPLDVLPAALLQALEAGQRPLASLLSDRGLSLSRSDLSIAKLSEAGIYDGNWARCSVLRSESGATALVSEVFQAAMWRKLDYMQRHAL